MHHNHAGSLILTRQYTRLSTIQCYRMIRPRWVSLGYSQAIMVVYTLSYYNVLIAYAGVYIIASLQTPLPWASDALLDEACPHTECEMRESAAVRFWKVDVMKD